MAHENRDDGLIRRYLLGRLGEDELQQLEERIMVDNELFDQVLLAEDEMVEDYVNRDLPESDRSDFESSFVSTPEGRQQVAYVSALRRHVKDISRPVWWRRPGIVPYLRLAAAAVIVIGLGLGIWQIIPRSEGSKGLKALAYAYRDQRPFEARISGFNYAPASTTRGGEQKVDPTARNLAESVLLEAVLEHPNATTHYAAGKLYLAEKKFDEAIKQFEEALTADPNNAQLHSDYGAALLERAKADNMNLQELSRSFDQFDHALKLDDSILEALFNRALCYQYMTLFQPAKEDWQKYLEKDPNSRWADEARHKLKELEEQENKTGQSQEQLFREFGNAYLARDDGRAWQILSKGIQARAVITNRLLDTYLDLAAKGQSDQANSKLQMLSYAGEIEKQRVGDRFISDVTHLYRQATALTLGAMARARALMRSGNEQFLKSNIADASDSYDKAREIFIHDGDYPEAEYTEYRLGYCYLREPDITRGLSVLERLARTCRSNNHTWLYAKTLSAIADARFSLNDYSIGIDCSMESLNISERIEDIDTTLRNIAQLASESYLLSDYSKSIGFLQRGFSIARTNAIDQAQLELFYSIAASSFTQMDLYSAAKAYQVAALQIATQIGVPLIMSRGYAQLGVIYARMKNHDEAIKNAMLGYEIGEGLADKSAGKEMMAHASLWLGNIFRETEDLNKAIASYTFHIETCDDLKFPAEVYSAHKGKLLCHIAQGDNAAAQTELQTTLNFFERYRSRISEESNRNAFFDNEQGIYDVATDFVYSRMGDARMAFEYSEASRARSLLDLASASIQIINRTSSPDVRVSSVSQPLDLVDIQTRMPERTQILQYAALNDKILAFVVSKTGFWNAEEIVPEGELSKKVLCYLHLLSEPSDNEAEITAQAKGLYDLLIRPIEAHLDKDKYLCVVADKVLNYLPFSALLSSASNRYLVNDYLIGAAPSSTLFIRCTEVAKRKSGAREEKLLSIGNPLFDRAAYPSLPDLPSSAREAEAIGDLYKSSTVLVGAEARKSQISRMMTESDVVHLAMHYVTDRYSPIQSKFLLAKEPTQSNQDHVDGCLQPFEIYGMKLSRTRLVVLSACETGIERAYRGEGAISVARPFICAGAPLVVASLWQVDSDSTTALMISFHEHRKRNGLATADALRAAQLEMLNSTDQRFHQPYYWAPFAIIGGYAIF